MGRITKAVIPAAGMGTRFLPATKSQPKEMLPVVDKPSIQYVVEEAARAGLVDVLVITGRGKHAIEDHFDRNFELEYYLEEKGKEALLKEIRDVNDLADFHYIRQRDPLGLGHAVSVAREHVGDEPFAVLLGDEPGFGCIFHEGRYDIGNKFDFLRANIELALARPDLGPELSVFLADLVRRRGL